MATPTPALPTLVVFAGAFHTTDYLAPLSSTLTQDGFRVACHSLPSVGSGSVGLADDVASMAAVLDGLIDGQAKDVVLVLHSYAGIPGSVVIGGRSKTAREKAGKAGGIVGVVYIGALLPRESDSLFTLVRSVWPEWLHINASPSQRRCGPGAG
jgi:pimeloyl-ACP methyl ester carboxylesterase